MTQAQTARTQPAGSTLDVTKLLTPLGGTHYAARHFGFHDGSVLRVIDSCDPDTYYTAAIAYRCGAEG